MHILEVYNFSWTKFVSLLLPICLEIRVSTSKILENSSKYWIKLLKNDSCHCKVPLQSFNFTPIFLFQISHVSPLSALVEKVHKAGKRPIQNQSNFGQCSTNANCFKHTSTGRFEEVLSNSHNSHASLGIQLMECLLVYTPRTLHSITNVVADPVGQKI